MDRVQGFARHGTPIPVLRGGGGLCSFKEHMFALGTRVDIPRLNPSYKMSHATKSWTKATKFANLALVLDLTGGDAIYTTPKGVYIASPFSFFFMLLFSFFRGQLIT